MEQLNLEIDYHKIVLDFIEKAEDNEFRIEKKLGEGLEKIVYDIGNNLCLKLPKNLIELFHKQARLNEKNGKVYNFITERHSFLDDVQIDNELSYYEDFIDSEIGFLMNPIIFSGKLEYIHKEIPHEFSYYISPIVETSTHKDELLHIFNKTDEGKQHIEIIKNICKKCNIYWQDILANSDNYGYDNEGNIKIIDFGYNELC